MVCAVAIHILVLAGTTPLTRQLSTLSIDPRRGFASAVQATRLLSDDASVVGGNERWARLNWLQVSAAVQCDTTGPCFTITDQWGRSVALNGANVEHEERNLGPEDGGFQRPIDAAAYADGACPPNICGYAEPPICEVDAGAAKFAQNDSWVGRNDFAQLRRMGFNVARLPISWSELEPVPGEYNATYIDRLAQLVDWAEAQGVYTLLDFHQDLFSRHIRARDAPAVRVPYLTPSSGQDGAPAWAVHAPGWPPLAPAGLPNLNLAVLRAFQSFWENAVVPGVPQGSAPGPGLQDHFIGALAAVARRFVNRSAVVGFEIMNEPQPGAGDLWPWSFASSQLYPFYTRTIQALTGEDDGKPTCGATVPLNASCAYPDAGVRDTRHLIFIEPCAVRNQFDVALQDPPSGPLSRYANVVYAPHVYTRSFTLWSPPWDFAASTAVAEANARRAALFIGEYGGNRHDLAHRVPHVAAAAAARRILGTTEWAWKSNCVTANYSECQAAAWTIVDPAPGCANASAPAAGPNGDMRPEAVAVLSRPHPRGLAGRLVSHAFNITTRGYTLVAEWPAGVAAAGAGQAGTADGASGGARGPSGSAGDCSISGILAAAGVPRVVATVPPSEPGSAVHGCFLTPHVLSSTGDGSPQPPPSSTHVVRLADYSPSLDEALHAGCGGSVSEVYLPPSVRGNVTVSGAGTIAAVVLWPDGSRSVYIEPPPAPQQPSVASDDGTGQHRSSASSDHAAAAALRFELTVHPAAAAAAASKSTADGADGLRSFDSTHPSGGTAHSPPALLISADLADATSGGLHPHHGQGHLHHHHHHSPFPAFSPSSAAHPHLRAHTHEAQGHEPADTTYAGTAEAASERRRAAATADASHGKQDAPPSLPLPDGASLKAAALEAVARGLACAGASTAGAGSGTAGPATGAGTADLSGCFGSPGQGPTTADPAAADSEGAGYPSLIEAVRAHFLALGKAAALLRAAGYHCAFAGVGL